MSDLENFFKAIDYAISEIPELKAFIDKPGVLQVVLQASQNSWTAAQLQAHLYDTDYWKSTNDAQRGWDVLRALNPGEAGKQWNTQVQHAWDVVGRLGVDNLTVDQVNPWIQFSIYNGLDDRTLQQGIINMMQGQPVPKTGDLAAAMSFVKGTANNYGVTVSDQGAFNYAAQLAEQRADNSTINEAMKNAAISRYGQNTALVDALNRGQNVRQYADPYIALASKELEISPDQVDLTDPKWNKMLSTSIGADGKTQQPMQLWQWQRTVRTDPTYGWDTTQTARDLATQAGLGILQKFGAVA